MDIRGGISGPQDNGFWFMGSWIPSTPEKIIPQRSNPSTDVRYEYPFGGENWKNLAGTSNVYSQAKQNDKAVAQHSNLVSNVDRSNGYYGDLPETNQMENYIEGSSFQALLQSGWTSELEELLTENRDFVLSANRLMLPTLQGQNNFEDIDNILFNQKHQYYTSQSRNVETLPAKSNVLPQLDGNRGHTLSKTMLPPPENHSSGLFSSSSSRNLPHQYEFLGSCHPSYDQNLEQRLQANAMSSNAKSVHVVPIVSPSAKSGNRHLELQNFGIAEQLTHEKNKENLITAIEEETQRQCDGLLQNIVDSSSAAIPAQYPERHDSMKGDDQGINLNETPPLKTPKRRKHRPKVIIEGKPKRIPKPSTTNQSTEKPIGKRKYVRRKGLNESATPPADIKVTKYSTTEPAEKSCRRALQFDAEKKEVDILESLPSEFRRGNGVCQTSSSVQLSQYDNRLVGSMPSRLLNHHNMRYYNSPTESKVPGKELSPSVEQNVDNSHFIRGISEKENSDLYQNRHKAGNAYLQQNFHLEAENQLLPQMEHRLDNAHFIRRILEKENSDLCQNRSKPGNGYMMQNFNVEAMWQLFNQTKGCYVQKNPTEIKLHNTQMVPKILPNPFERRGWKRNYPYSIVDADIYTGNVPRSQLLCQEIRRADEHPNGYNLCSSLNIQKKKRLGKEMCANIEYSSPEIKTTSEKYLGLGEFTSENRHGKINVHSGSTNDRKIKQLPMEQSFPMIGKTGWMEKSHPSITNVKKHNLLPQSSLRKSSIQGGEQAYIWKASILKRKQDTKLDLSQSYTSTTEKDQGSLADDIIWKMKNLDLNERRKDRRWQTQAIVPYNGSGAIVPSVGSDFIKKRIPRPKVDLDPDTERVWSLLMASEGSEGLETDKEKEKWWEEEREVFRGRADSFIARMHLVQGDRRFSQWKGSVVDSVIGVFLTQNVSDHLSSSAFMSLASRYPLKSNINSRVSNDDASSILIIEPDISPITSDNTTQWCKEVMDEQSFSKPQYSTRHQGDAPVSERVKSSMEAQKQNVEEEVISSQDSDSSVTQCLGGIRSCSGSNSEAEDCPTGQTSLKNYGPDSTNCQTVQNTTLFSKFYGHVTGNSTLDDVSRHANQLIVDRKQGAPNSGMDKIVEIYRRPDLNIPPSNNDNQSMQGPVTPTKTPVLPVMPDIGILEVEGCETFSEESTYSWSSIGSEFNMKKDLTCLSFEKLGKLVGRNMEQQNGMPGSQETPRIGIQSVSEHTAQTSCVSTLSERDRLSPDQQLERSHNFQSESATLIEPSKASADKQTISGQSVHVPDHTVKVNKVGDIKSKANNQSGSAKGLFGPNLNEQSSSPTNYEGEAKFSKIKGKKAGKEKNTAVDWDNLRKQVLANGMKKERSKDAMDSLDYEAVRLAHVSEIAETIKERGMNNLLAARIKEFLNRILEEHGSIDLEWLRDVPPEKAKDYLLSIRGIGLKSVECVRLLTLRHLAFPVDTNVGRIAVRLGWVPLRPLPESLQLHLLELYPMLESIQKFLWPRLCKLDQRTLYELHYQLITFGKVFCTKSKPNCNACPMRGECRHFASAFASARLALPGPEERGIVSSTNPIPAAIPPEVGITPMPLLIETGPESRKCEPIIEVPLTPEQEWRENCGSDIEDSLFEDPDDIPTIKLNIEELKTTLKNFIPEGDMSKALVALNTAAASVPTPKLKNVSRLRTEHQVYELPDSHPLLEGMDRREPDDPSPYLLAIWKPGETADSFQLDGRSCKSLDPDRLCNEETCFSCNSIKEANSQIVRGTILVPCRTAMRGSFPLNGTYFQVNEMFADHESSHSPIFVPREWIWNLPRQTVYFGTSVSTIFRGLSTEGIQYCFWRGFICVRGFDKKARTPRPLSARLHFSASKLSKTKYENKH